MTFVLGIIATLLVMILFFRLPIPTLVGFVILVGSIWLYLAYTSTLDQNEAARVRSPLAASDVEVDGLTLYQVESLWHLEGSFTNHSSSMLTQLGLSVQIENCQSGGECEVVGQDTVRIYENLPPGQSATFEALVDFRNIPAFDDWTWTYRITEAVGE